MEENQMHALLLSIHSATRAILVHAQVTSAVGMLGDEMNDGIQEMVKQTEGWIFALHNALTQGEP